MEFQMEKAFEILERTPRVLEAMLGGLSPEWSKNNEGPGTWSPLEVLGHLIHGEETDWIARARIILEHGEARPFDPFDREGMFTKFKGWPLEQLLREFAAARRKSLEALRSWKLSPADFNRTGRHPDFGRVTLAQLIATWAVHDLTHIVQISRVMAKQYDAAVGPWKAYLSVLTR
ncbi:MAG TPA: DinB family protein [Candidatus Nitrosotenuis sp.]|nr:DinB family protein [Candidatus Nitrosotenuis sp.]